MLGWNFDLYMHLATYMISIHLRRKLWEWKIPLGHHQKILKCSLSNNALSIFITCNTPPSLPRALTSH